MSRHIGRRHIPIENRHRRLRAAARLEQLERRTLLANISWTGGGDGMSWHNGANWSGGSVPGPADDVTISVAATPTVRFTTGSGTIRSLVSDEIFELNGGTLTVSTTIQVNNTFRLGAGTLAGATVLAGGGGQPLIVTSPAATLDGVVMSAALDLTQSSTTVTVVNGMVLNGTASVGNAAGTNFSTITFGRFNTPSGSLTGTGEIVFGGTSSNRILNGSGQSGAAAALTIGPNITIRGKSGQINNSQPAGSIISQGTIRGEIAAGAIIIGISASGTFFNQGTLHVSNGASMTITNLRDNIGIATLSGAGSSLLIGGTNCVNNLGLSAPAGATLGLSGTWSNPAGSSISATNATLALGNASNTWSNAGTISATNTTLGLGGSFTMADLSNISRSNAAVTLSGTLDMQGGSLVLNPANETWSINNGTLRNGTITPSAVTGLSIVSQATLDGMTVHGDINLSQATGIIIGNGLVLNGTMAIGNAAGTTSADVIFGFGSMPAGMLSGSATLVFGGSSSNSIRTLASGNFTIGPNVLIRGAVGELIFTQQLVSNQGTISSDFPNGIILINTGGIGTFTNEGALHASNGADLLITGMRGNINTATLSGAGGGRSCSQVPTTSITWG